MRLFFPQYDYSLEQSKTKGAALAILLSVYEYQKLTILKYARLELVRYCFEAILESLKNV